MILVSNNTLKGIPGHVRKGLALATYEECLYSNTRFNKDIFNLRFYNKHMSLTKNSKVILSCFEDKRYYINNLESYGYGHPKTPKNNIYSSNNDDGDVGENTLGGKGEKRKRQETIPGRFPSKEKEIRYVYSRKNYYVCITLGGLLYFYMYIYVTSVCVCVCVCVCMCMCLYIYIYIYIYKHIFKTHI